ncbi:hypothetical protein QUB75_20855 [Microcoleus sp. K1-B6]
MSRSIEYWGAGGIRAAFSPEKLPVQAIEFMTAIKKEDIGASTPNAF